MEVPNLTNEITLIEDEFVRTFTEAVLQKVPKYFWTLPASSTGKYHPPIERGPYGLVWHTKAVCKVGKILLSSKPEIDSSCALSAMILHDVGRYGLEEKHSSYSLNNHPDVAADLIKSLIDPNTDITHENYIRVDKIAQAVRSHMGRWGKTLPQSELDWIVHLADNVAASYY